MQDEVGSLGERTAGRHPPPFGTVEARIRRATLEWNRRRRRRWVPTGPGRFARPGRGTPRRSAAARGAHPPAMREANPGAALHRQPLRFSALTQVENRAFVMRTYPQSDGAHERLAGSTSRTSPTIHAQRGGSGPAMLEARARLALAGPDLCRRSHVPWLPSGRSRRSGRSGGALCPGRGAGHGEDRTRASHRLPS